MFEVDHGLRALDDVSYGDAVWSMKRGALVPSTELSLPGLVYGNARPADERGLADPLAFQNRLNPFLQLRLAPHPRSGSRFFMHWFRVLQRIDATVRRHGAFDRGSSASPRALRRLTIA